MKKILFVTVIFSLLALPLYAKEEVKINRDNAYKEMAKSNASQQAACKNITRNFKRDSLFSTYMKTRCTQVATERQQSLAVLYPYPNRGIANYNANYPILLSSYVKRINEQEIKDYKFVVDEYCKYASRRVIKKDPEACSASRIKSLFEVNLD